MCGHTKEAKDYSVNSHITNITERSTNTILPLTERESDENCAGSFISPTNKRNTNPYKFQLGERNFFTFLLLFCVNVCFLV